MQRALQFQTLAMVLSSFGAGCSEDALPPVEDGEETGEPAGTGETGEPEATGETGETGEPEPDPEPLCGDGVIDPGEDCDDGPDNADAAECTSLCRLALCGDGLVFAPAEGCDDGNAVAGDGCSPACVVEECGNGSLDPDEECDEGDNNGPGQACKADCSENVCGDADQSPSEGCDDGNTEGGDGCTPSCKLESCGDGVLDPGEECDDGNDTENDACTTLCRAPACGDAIIQPTLGEDCDDGNANNVDDCPADCTLAVCGDGIVESAEACDTGDDVGDGLSACSPGCQLNFCGDGYHHAPSEGCDDGNLADDDGCDSACTSTITQVASSGAHTCIVTRWGGVKCWGNGDDGQLGYASTIDIGDNEVPANVGLVDVGGVVTQIDTGLQHTCAVLDSGEVRCWGRGSDGRLGYGNTENIGDDETPATAGAVDVGGTAVQIVAGYNHTCVLLDDGAVRCWGNGEAGQLGYGNTDSIGDDETPATAGDVDVGEPVMQIAAGGAGCGGFGCYVHTCALLETGAVRCWGFGGWGQLGYGNTESIGDDETPASAGDVDVGGNVEQLSLGMMHSCALLTGGTARCWGDSLALGYYPYLGQVGDDETPASAGDLDIGGVVTHISGGADHTCALLDDGAVRCWGDPGGAPLGYGDNMIVGDDETPAEAGDVDVGAGVVQLSAGNSRTCVLTSAGGVRCWGWGLLGYGNSEAIGDDETPATAGDVPVF